MRGVRHPRLDHGDRLVLRRAARRPPRHARAFARGRGRLLFAVLQIAVGSHADLHDVRAGAPAPRARVADHDHRRQRHGPADLGPDDARPGRVALPDARDRQRAAHGAVVGWVGEKFGARWMPLWWRRVSPVSASASPRCGSCARTVTSELRASVRSLALTPCTSSEHSRCQRPLRRSSTTSATSRTPRSGTPARSARSAPAVTAASARRTPTRPSSWGARPS